LFDEFIAPLISIVVSIGGVLFYLPTMKAAFLLWQTPRDLYGLVLVWSDLAWFA